MRSAVGAGGSCVEEVVFKLDRHKSAFPGRWTSTWKGRCGGARTACLRTALWWEVMLGREQAQAGAP